MRGSMPPPPSLTPAAVALERLSRAVAASPADGTVIALLESWRLLAGPRAAAGRPAQVEREIVVRVEEAGRPGAFRAEDVTAVELEAATRQAMARARASARPPGGVPLQPPGARGRGRDEEDGTALHDAQLASMSAEEGQERLRGLLRDEEWGRLEWWEVALTVAGSGGVARHQRATGLACELRCSRRAGAGQAHDAARSLAGLDLPALAERARRRHTTEEAAPASTEDGTGGALVLSAEAMGGVLAALAPHLLAAAAWEEEGAFATGRRGERALASELTLVDDAGRTPGLPFPLGLAGGLETAAVLVEGGVLRGPAADPLEAAALGVPATRQWWTGAPSLPQHLHLLPGGASEQDLLRAAGDGVFVGAVERAELWDRGRLAARLWTRGRRHIAGGSLGAPLPDAVWEVELPRALGTVLGLGAQVATRADASPLGGITAPGAALSASGVWL